MMLIELCQYTLRQSLSDLNEYYTKKISAEDLIDNLNKNGGKK